MGSCLPPLVTFLDLCIFALIRKVSGGKSKKGKWLGKIKANSPLALLHQTIRAMSGKGTSLLPSELTAAKWLAIRPLEFFSPSSSMASFTCAVCSMPYDTSKKRDQCASAHAKAVQGLAAVEGLSGQSLEEMKEEEEKKKK